MCNKSINLTTSSDDKLRCGVVINFDHSIEKLMQMIRIHPISNKIGKQIVVRSTNYMGEKVLSLNARGRLITLDQSQKRAVFAVNEVLA